MDNTTLKQLTQTMERTGCSIKGKGNGMIKLHSDQEVGVSDAQPGPKPTCLNPDHNFTWNDLGIEEVGK